MNVSDAYRGKTVLVTGHTGFKGSWLSEWLTLLGARVVGYSLDIPSTPSHFTALGLGERVAADVRGDVRSLDALQAVIDEHQPQFIFHLAAQPIVRRSFKEPHYTVETNLGGSLNVLEAVRRAERDCVVIMITTDKVYENEEWVHAYRENDRLGGHDLYSASKACAEIVISAYRRSFFERPAAQGGSRVAVASVRGGNVIGGGDWSENRIVPDAVRSLAHDQPIRVRNPRSTRPWQHVLDLLGGYLQLGAEIAHARAQGDEERLRELCSAFNFGPLLASNRTVGELVEEILKHWPGEWENLHEAHAEHEAGKLNLTIDKAVHMLGWRPRWSFEECVAETVAWYRGYYMQRNPSTEAVRRLTQEQILAYMGQQPDQHAAARTAAAHAAGGG
ncbi:CDP-glucose 4,6-dehydratase [Ectothiorhodospiraceae bacterium 2226]|nr:CDP-glucose 4,6-dehydratase [Ectothiorhodospiraceae bacterium 2226]